MSADIIQELRTRLRLDANTGRLFWAIAPKGHPDLQGREAGSIRMGHSGKGYWHVKVNSRPVKRSHIVFALTHGRMPSPCVDHIDGDSLNDRPANLREATVLENAWNHKRRKRRLDLPMGVRLTAAGRFQARLGYCGKVLHLGAFDTPEEARAAHLAKRRELYGEFA